MATKTYCDRCGSEIARTPYRLTLPLRKEKDLCEECQKGFLEWLKYDKEVTE